MGKIFDMVFPMIANHRDNSNVRKKIHPTDDTGKEIAPEGILSYIENSDKLDLKILKEQYDETFRTKEKIEDKQVNNDFLLKLKNVSLFVVTNSSSVTGLPGLTLFLLREPEVRGTTFKT